MPYPCFTSTNFISHPMFDFWLQIRHYPLQNLTNYYACVRYTLFPLRRTLFNIITICAYYIPLSLFIRICLIWTTTLLPIVICQKNGMLVANKAWILTYLYFTTFEWCIGVMLHCCSKFTAVEKWKINFLKCFSTISRLIF